MPWRGPGARREDPQAAYDASLAAAMTQVWSNRAFVAHAADSGRTVRPPEPKQRWRAHTYPRLWQPPHGEGLFKKAQADGYSDWRSGPPKSGLAKSGLVKLGRGPGAEPSSGRLKPGRS